MFQCEYGSICGQYVEEFGDWCPVVTFQTIHEEGHRIV